MAVPRDMGSGTCRGREATARHHRRHHAPHRLRWLLMAMACGSLFGNPLGGAAESATSTRRLPLQPRHWEAVDELMQRGEIEAPAPILEVHLLYDASVTPYLHITRVHLKRGYAPQYDPLETGYVLSLHGENGDTLSALTFQIPNRVFNPPPATWDRADSGPTVLQAVNFAVTVPMTKGAVTLRLTDPQGLLIAEQSLRELRMKSGQPDFRSFRHRPAAPEASPSSEAPRRALPRLAAWWAWLTETAEAATNSSTTLDIAIVGDQYTAADLTQFQQDVDRVVSHFMTYEPYASRAGQIVFQRVENSTVSLGCVHDVTTGRLITCNNSTVTSVVNDAGVPYDKIIVLVKDATYGGSGGSIAVSYNGSSAPQVVVHEFGHTLGGLLDEYNLYSTNGSIDNRTYANCFAGAPPAVDWNGLVAASDYAAGCKYPNWYRPSPCSIMLTLSCQYFNAVSQRQLNTRIDVYAGTPAPTPSVSLSNSPTLIALGGASALTWSGTNVASCTASGGWSGSRPVSGSETVQPSATAAYTLTCASGSTTPAQTVTVTVDTQPPTVSVSGVTDGAIVSGALTATAAATDDRGIARVEFSLDGSLLLADNTPPYSLAWDTSRSADGAHTLQVQAVDVAGNVASVSLRLTVRNLPIPTVSLGVNPILLGLGGQATLTWTSTAASFCTADGAWSGNEPMSGTLVMNPTATATYTLTCGNSSGTTNQSATITVDAVPPSVRFTAPSGSSLLTGVVQVSIDATDDYGLQRVEVSADGVALGTLSTAPYTMNWDTTKTSDGAHTLQVQAVDIAGNVSTATLGVTVQSIPLPTLSFSASPTLLGVGGSTVLSWSSVQANRCTASGAWSGDQPLGGQATMTPHQTLTYTLSCLNSSGTIQQNVTITVDAQPPTVQFTAPPSGAVLQGAVDLAVDAADDHAVSRIDFVIDGTQIGSSTTALYHYRWDTTHSREGGHTLQATALDIAGNQSTVTLPVTVWNVPLPTVSLAVAQPLLGIGGMTTVSWTSTTATNCTASGGWSGDQPLSGQQVVSPSATTTYTLMCVNTTGSASQSATITVDAVPPSVRFLAPSNVSPAKGTVTITADATDDRGVQRVELSIDNSTLATLTTAPYQIDWNTVNVADGPHTLYARATDLAGNVATTTLALTVQNASSLPPVDTQAPVVTILSPPAGVALKLWSSTTIRVSATDDRGVTKMELYLNGWLKVSSNSGVVSFTWRPNIKGTYTITAKAYDAVGHIGTASLTVRVTR